MTVIIKSCVGMLIMSGVNRYTAMFVKPIHMCA